MALNRMHSVSAKSIKGKVTLRKDKLKTTRKVFLPEQSGVRTVLQLLNLS